MRAHEALASGSQALESPTGRQKCVRGLRRQSTAFHGVVDTFARGWRHHARGISGDDHVAAIVPAAHGPQRDRRALTAEGFSIGEAG